MINDGHAKQICCDVKNRSSHLPSVHLYVTRKLHASSHLHHSLVLQCRKHLWLPLERGGTCSRERLKNFVKVTHRKLMDQNSILGSLIQDPIWWLTFLHCTLGELYINDHCNKRNRLLVILIAITYWDSIMHKGIFNTHKGGNSSNNILR